MIAVVLNVHEVAFPSITALAEYSPADITASL